MSCKLRGLGWGDGKLTWVQALGPAEQTFPIMPQLESVVQTLQSTPVQPVEHWFKHPLLPPSPARVELKSGRLAVGISEFAQFNREQSGEPVPGLQAQAEEEGEKMP